MRILVAGATGALGVPVVRQLISDGHTVIGLAKTKQGMSHTESLGAKAVIADALDAESLRKAVATARPDAVVHALTAIPSWTHASVRPRCNERFTYNRNKKSAGRGN